MDRPSSFHRLSDAGLFAVFLFMASVSFAQTKSPIPAPILTSVQSSSQTPAPTPSQSPIQTPSQTPSQNSGQNSAQAPASTLPAGHTIVLPAPKLTPVQLGDSLEARQRYQAAITAYGKVPHPTAEVWNKMGIAYQMMFDLKDATRCYRESLKMDPRNSTVLNNLGTVYDSSKEYRAAERIYRKALKVDPKSAYVLKNLGTNLLVQHKYSRGWDEYKKALAIDPDIFQDSSSPKVENQTTVQERGAMNYFMARGCVRVGETDCAIQYLRLALDEGYTNPKKLAADTDFASLHDNPQFKELLAEQDRKRPVSAQ